MGRRRPIPAAGFHINVVLFLALVTQSFSINLTALLAPYKELSSFAGLLSHAPSIASEMENRSAVTILAVPNSYIGPSLDLARRLSTASLADVLRCHILLQYISWAALHKIPVNSSSETTLYQTTGRAISNSGYVNLTRDDSTGSIAVFSYSSKATVLSLVDEEPYNYTILSVNSLMIPSGVGLTASAAIPPPVVNITRALLDGHDFNVAVSMLEASGVVDEFEADEGGAGITLFIPTDSAFLDLPRWASFQSLPAIKKAVVLKFHILHSYYPLGSLESIVNPVQPTLATEDMGAGRFTLNISRMNGSVSVNSGIVHASVTQTVFDQNPVAIFGVSNVLLPEEYFGASETNTPSPPDTSSDSSFPAENVAEPPETLPSPVASPGFREEINSGIAKPKWLLTWGRVLFIWAVNLLIWMG